MFEDTPTPQNGQAIPLLDVALAYARFGWPVFPIRQKLPLRGSSGHHDASSDPAEVRRLWRQARQPDGIGVDLERAGLVLVDLDRHGDGPDGVDTWNALTVDDPVPDTPEAITGGGGRHLYFKRPGKLRATSWTGPKQRWPGVDVKANGYAVLPPSAHPSGDRYRWHLRPVDEPPATLPLWLFEELGSTPEPSKNGRSPAAGGPIPSGQRNTTMASLAGTMRRRGLSETAILAALQEHNAEHCNPPLSESEVSRIAVSVGRYEPDPKASAPTPPFCYPGDFPTSGEMGVADRLVHLYGDRLRWCLAFDEWLVYDGQRWARDRAEDALALAKLTARSIAAEASAAEDDDLRKALLKLAKRVDRRGALSSMLELAKPDLAVLPDQLDADPWALNVANGTLDLRSGDLHPHDPGDLITKLAPVEYVPNADSGMVPEIGAEAWREFLATATDGDDELADYLQRAAGYTLAGESVEDVWFFVHGPTATAKSTFLRALRGTLGDYAVTVSTEAFLAQWKDGGGPKPEIAKLEGARLVMAEEIDAGRRLATATVKNLTGGTPISARGLYEKPREWVPACTVWVASNDRPKVRDDDAAIWRRLREVPFTHQVPEEQRDPSLKDSRHGLAQQAGPAILAWAVTGCLAWQRDGLGGASRVQAATADYRDSMDPLAEWLAERAVQVPDAFTPTSDLYASYRAWCEDAGQAPLAKAGSNGWGARMNVREFEQAQRTVKGKRVRGYVGIGIREGV